MDMYEAYAVVQTELWGDVLSDVADETGLSVCTLRNWRDHLVECPRLPGLLKVLKYYGYRVEVVKQEGATRAPKPWSSLQQATMQ